VALLLGGCLVRRPLALTDSALTNSALAIRH
jgi:hypothetical protein